ncbi:MAG: histidine triad nucleotide-binding protein [Anaerolineales bacterium]
MDCIFCKIVAGEAPARIVYRDDLVTAFHDVHPAAPVHLLIVPNRHVATLNDLTPADESWSGHLLETARRLAAEQGLAGYRLVLNVGAEGGQSVFHLHLHLVGGRRLQSHLGLA